MRGGCHGGTRLTSPHGSLMKENQCLQLSGFKRCNGLKYLAKALDRGHSSSEKEDQSWAPPEATVTHDSGTVSTQLDWPAAQGCRTKAGFSLKPPFISAVGGWQLCRGPGSAQ